MHTKNGQRPSPRALVTGAGGFIGHHLVKSLTARGYWVRGVDMKQPEYEPTSADEFLQLDLRRWEHCAAGHLRRRRGLQPGREHGRHRLHRVDKAEIMRDNGLDQPRI